MLRLFRSPPRQPAKTPIIEVAFAGRRHRVVIKRVNGARRLTLRIRAATLEAVLTMPRTCSFRAARAFAEDHAEWIATRLARLPDRVPLAAGSVIPLRGVATPIVMRQSLRTVAWVDVGAGLDGVPEQVICVSGDAGQQRRRILDLLRREARRDLDGAARKHAAALGKTFRTLTLRDTRSRWGSCTAAGGLNFSWRLILAPSFVLDYLAAHEVAHLVEMNHSAAYWAVAESLSPNLAQAEAWLKANGAALHRYG